MTVTEPNEPARPPSDEAAVELRKLRRLVIAIVIAVVVIAVVVGVIFWKRHNDDVARRKQDQLTFDLCRFGAGNDIAALYNCEQKFNPDGKLSP